jgi:hypothetical protein
MTDTHDPLPRVDQSSTWLVRLNHNRKPAAYGLLVLALVLALIPLLTLIKVRWDYAPLTLWGGLMALIALGGGLYLLLRESPAEQDVDSLRLAVLSAGGLAGLGTWLLALALAWQWYATIFGGLEAWQGTAWWQLWVCLLALFGGLALMFISLLPARAVERSDPALRRLLYGYNAVLSGLLLLAILGVVNVLIYNYSTTAFDWTEASIYTLSDQSKNVLTGLERPTKVYVILPRSEELDEIRNLLDNCRAINDKLQVKYFSLDPEDVDQIDKVEDLAKRYLFQLQEGVLVVSGTEPDVNYQFLKLSELFDEGGRMRPGSSARTFKGENTLISALSFLEEGKTKPVVYFTQGNGELDITDLESSQLDQGGGVLRERLQKGNYEVKGLHLSDLAGLKPKDPLIVASARVPDDAAMVIVMAPRTPFSEPALKALRDYMNPADPSKKKGKLVVLLDVLTDPNGNLVRTGLEDFLAEWNVQVSNNRILRAPTNLNPDRDPRSLVVTTSREVAARNPIARSFAGEPIRLRDVRHVAALPAAPNRPEGVRYSVDTLLQTWSADPVWPESNLRADPAQLMSELLKDRELQASKLTTGLSVAVAVSEPVTPSNPSDPHAFMRQQEQTPRLVVFGDATFASNRFMAERFDSMSYFPLFTSTLAWLRERPSSVGVPPKTRNTFTLNVSDDVAQRTRWLPTVLMFVGVIGLGTGVWVIRRR